MQKPKPFGRAPVEEKASSRGQVKINKELLGTACLCLWRSSGVTFASISILTSQSEPTGEPLSLCSGPILTVDSREIRIYGHVRVRPSVGKWK